MGLHLRLVLAAALVQLGRTMATSASCRYAREAARRGDLAGALGALEEARVSARTEKSDLASAWSSIMVALAQMRSPALLFFCELMYHDGVRLYDLDTKAMTFVEALLPPELNEVGDDERLLSVLANHPRFRDRQLPRIAQDEVFDAQALWTTCAGPVQEVLCAGSTAQARAALAEARHERRPVILRDVGAHWRGLDWTTETLADAFETGAVCRLSPTEAVAFCRESHPEVASGRITPPSVTLTLPGTSAAKRLLRTDETLYIQALAPRRLMCDVGYLAFARHDDDVGDTSSPARVWASRAGVYSPLHFDAQDSHLIQLVGHKRLVLWPPSALEHLRPYEAGHPLARRCRVDVLDRPDARKAFLRDAQPEAIPIVRDAALDATLFPGDAIWFPSYWAHHTVALKTHVQRPQQASLSISLSLREEDGVVVGA